MDILQNVTAKRSHRRQLNVTLSPELYEKFKKMCYDQRISHCDSIAALVRDAVARHTSNTPRSVPATDPKARLIADGFILALREAKHEGLL